MVIAIPFSEVEGWHAPAATRRLAGERKLVA
jgi:hypothetical protein